VRVRPEDGILQDARWGPALRERWRRIRECRDPRELRSLYAALVTVMERVPPRLRIAFGGTITVPRQYRRGRFRMLLLNFGRR